MPIIRTITNTDFFFRRKYNCAKHVFQFIYPIKDKMTSFMLVTPVTQL